MNVMVRPLLLLLAGAAWFGGLTVRPACADLRPDYLMNQDPDLTLPVIEPVLDERNLALWMQALARPEADLRRLAADAIAAAHRQHFPGMSSAGPALLEALGRSPSHPDASWAIAQALIVLDMREAAAKLFEMSQGPDEHLRLLVEPTLAEWDFRPARKTWLLRLADPGVDRRDLILALTSAGRVRDEQALAPIMAIVMDRTRPSDFRLAASRAAGSITDSGLEARSQELAPDSSTSVIDRLCAVSILALHASDAARRQLTSLAHDPEPTVTAAALQTLFTIEPQLVLPLTDEALANRDANVRWQGIRALVTLPTPGRILVVGRSLDDLHPRNRTYARDELFRLAQQLELDAAVREAGMTALAGTSWREQEQAALLLAALDHKPAGPRLVELLESTRSEVMVSTAWALRKLALPETLPALLDKATRQTEKPTPGSDGVDPQVAHLLEAMTSVNYEPAVPLMRRYVPKGSGGETARSAAIWGLGHLLQDQPLDEGLASQLIERVKDTGGMPPEFVHVRQMGAVTLGRLQAKSQLPELARLLGPAIDPGPDDYAQAWAVEQMTGTKPPYADLVRPTQLGWFLEGAP